jgi:hypothetical protein
MGNKSPNKKYRVGRLRDPRPEDRSFEMRRDAIAVAFDSAKDEDVWAVWFEDNAVAVIYDGQMFTG